MKQPKPNLFIVGAPKAGTTSLAMNLSNSSEVFLPNIKEPNFFIEHSFTNAVHIHDFKNYLNLFKTNKAFKYYCDASTSYLFDLDVANKIKEFNPDAKIIIILRDPVERAYSHYNMEKNVYQRENLDFFEALNLENKHDYFGFKVNPYVAPSLYYTQVKKYIDCFDKENLKIIILEKVKSLNFEVELFLDIKNLPNQRYNETKKIKNNFFSLLINSSILKNVRKYIPNSVKQFIGEKILFKKVDKETLSYDIKKSIYKKYFSEDVANLEKLLDLDLSRWKY